MIWAVVLGINGGDGSFVVGLEFVVESEKAIDNVRGVVVFDEDSGKDCRADSMGHCGVGPGSGG